MNHGFTNDEQQYREVCAWRDAAIADGWQHEPLYPNHEPEQRAAKLKHPEGFVAQIISRDNCSKGGKWKYEAMVSVWGPDDLCLAPGRIYSLDHLRARLRDCGNCGATDVDTVRYSFAGRCCEKCLPAMRKKHEYPGWCN